MSRQDLLAHMVSLQSVCMRESRARQQPSTEPNPHSLWRLGLALLRKGDLGSAHEYLETALAMYRQSRNVRGEAATLIGLGDAAAAGSCVPLGLKA